jgi:hypothetical protein
MAAFHEGCFLLYFLTLCALPVRYSISIMYTIRGFIKLKQGYGLPFIFIFKNSGCCSNIIHLCVYLAISLCYKFYLKNY